MQMAEKRNADELGRKEGLTDDRKEGLMDDRKEGLLDGERVGTNESELLWGEVEIQPARAFSVFSPFY
jgi:hypothetical protein